MLIKALGMAPDATPAQITDLLKTATPEQLLAIKQADEQFQIALKTLDVSVDKLAMEDTADARLRQTTEHDTIPAWLGIGIVLAFFAMAMVVLLGFGAADTVLAGTLIGYMAANAQQVVAYYFGSSSGSKAKDAMLWQSSPEPTPTKVTNAAARS